MRRPLVLAPSVVCLLAAAGGVVVATPPPTTVAAAQQSVSDVSPLRLVNVPKRVPAGAVIRLQVAFNGHPKPVQGTVERRLRGRWVPVTTSRLDQGEPAMVRFVTPGPVDLRISHGPASARRATPGRRVVVFRPRRPRVVAGDWPFSIAAVGSNLWVLSRDRRRARERVVLRLLDAASGSSRGAPVSVPPGLGDELRLTRAGDAVLLVGLGATSSPRAVELTPTLITGRLSIAAAAGDLIDGCPASCAAPKLRVAGREVPLVGRAVIHRTTPLVGRGRTGPVAAGPDLLWTLGLAPTRSAEAGVRSSGTLVARDPASASPLHEPTETGPLETPDDQLIIPDLLALPGAAWVRNSSNEVIRVTPDGRSQAFGSFAAIETDGSAVWALDEGVGTRGSTTPAIVRLRPAGAVDATTRRPVGERVFVERQLAIGRRAAWLIASLERTLVRVDLPPG